MATDGVKIIDGDTAHDTYWGIMDLYDNGATIETIRHEIPFPAPDYYEDFDAEIYTTAYALAIWEIGHMADEILQEVRRVIDKGAGAKDWAEMDVEMGKERQQELDILWDKIRFPNKEVREVKVYKLISDLLFSENDILTFLLPDNNYYATIVFKIEQYRGNCQYHFGKFLYKDEQAPTIKDIENAQIIGKKIPSGFGMDITGILSIGMEEIMNQGGIEAVLKREAEKTGSYTIGMNKTCVSHEHLTNFRDKFQKIGKLKMKENYKETSSLNIATDFDTFCQPFQHLPTYVDSLREDTFKMADLLE